MFVQDDDEARHLNEFERKWKRVYRWHSNRDAVRHWRASAFAPQSFLKCFGGLRPQRDLSRLEVYP